MVGSFHGILGLHPTLPPTFGGFWLRRSLVLYPLLIAGRFLSLKMFPSQSLSCTLPLPDAGTVLPSLVASLILSFAIFILQRWSSCFFFNCVWRCELFSELWHQTAVIVIPKSGKNHSLLGNFRPISLTSCLCKLLERMVSECLV